jgi:cardiolipin synthase (CMP-forming)
MSWRQLPNALTAMRIGLTPFLFGSIANDQPRQALLLLLIAAISDGLDGFLARRYGWQSRLGGLLDPLADKLLLNAAFLGLWMAGTVPGWLMLLVFGRDLVIVSGALGYHRLIGPLRAAPTVLGKFNTGVQIGFVLLMLLQLGFDALPPTWTQPAILAVAAITAASGMDYVIRWSHRAWRERRPDDRSP